MEHDVCIFARYLPLIPQPTIFRDIFMTAVAPPLTEHVHLNLELLCLIVAAAVRPRLRSDAVCMPMLRSTGRQFLNHAVDAPLPQPLDKLLPLCNDILGRGYRILCILLDAWLCGFCGCYSSGDTR